VHVRRPIPVLVRFTSRSGLLRLSGAASGAVLGATSPLDGGFPQGIYLEGAWCAFDRTFTRGQFDTLRDLKSTGQEPKMKVDKPRTDGSHRTGVSKRPRSGAEEACYKLYWTHAPEYLFGVRASPSGQFVYEGINPAFEGLLGISSEDIRQKAISDCVSDQDAKSISASCEACLAEGRPVRHRHRLTLGGRPGNFETVVAPVRGRQRGSSVRLIGSHIAVNEAATGPAESTLTRRAAANLGLRLLSLKEEIQQRIASDLHDSTCQHLIAASLNVLRMRRAMSGNGSAERLCDDIDASLEQAQREIRAFTYLLHPQNLLTDGLKATIEQFVDGFSARTSIKTSLEIAPEVDKLSYDRQRSVLRVIQEALANVFRHAQATQVKVAMEATATHFKLRITDNGRGMPTSQANSGAKLISFGVGIPAMKARLQQLGGTLEIHSSSARAHRGTTLCAVIPHSLPIKRARLPERRHSHPRHPDPPHTGIKTGRLFQLLEDVENPRKF
jgi:two-component system NarL family sensor kinase